MQKQNHFWLSIFLVVSLQLHALASYGFQENYPKIGDPCPRFTFDSLENYTVSSVSDQSLLGKNYILDFWSFHCSSSFKKLPELSRLQQKFADRFQFFLIGVNFSEKKAIRDIFEAYKNHYSLALPVTYYGEKPAQFGIGGVPHFIWIDSKGIVKAITAADFITEENILKFINGDNLNFPEHVNKVRRDSIRINFDYKKPLLINGNGGKDEDFLMRSVISKWNINTPTELPFTITTPATGHFMINGMDLAGIYKLAYSDSLKNFPFYEHNVYGKQWGTPIIKAKDSQRFKGNYHTGANLYSYDLIIPDSLRSFDRVQNFIRGDLKQIFGYKVKVIKKRMPYYAIKAKKGSYEKLKSKGGEPNFDYAQFVNFSFQNMRPDYIVKMLWNIDQEKPPYIDETKFPGNIDLMILGVIDDYDSVIAELNRMGIYLKLKKRKMKVIVISDP